MSLNTLWNKAEINEIIKHLQWNDHVKMYSIKEAKVLFRCKINLLSK